MGVVLVTLIIMGGLAFIALIVTVGLLIEDGKLFTPKTAAKKAEEASIAAMYRAKEALYREAENRLLKAGEGEPLDAIAMELLGMKAAAEQAKKQISRGVVECGHGYPPNQCPYCQQRGYA